MESLRTSQSLGAAWLQRVSALPELPVCWEPEGKTYSPVSARALHEEISAIARALRGYGLETGDRLALMAPNGRLWAAVDLAAQLLGVVLVPLYQGQRAAELQHILEDSAPTLVCLQGEEALAEVREALGEARYRPPIAAAGVRDSHLPEPAFSWGELLRYGERVAPDEPEAYNRTVGRDHLATLVYTSGTTGWPKGVELTHGNLLANIEASLRVLKILPGDRFLSFLPLAHIFERTGGHFIPYLCGAEVAYARSTQTVAADLGRAQPTILVAVPRMYQLFHDRAQTQRSRDRLADRLIRWATGDGGRPHPILGGPARHLLRRRFRQRMGGRMRLLVSGGAALPREVGHFFRNIGLPVLEGYGQTETAPVISVNPQEAVKVGTVGRPVPGVDVRIASDGEILVRGPNVMRGYWNRPEETAAVLHEGWLHTGDAGELDEDGYLVITDRLKEILVTSGGKNIPPQPLELRLAAQPVIQQAVVFGNGQPYLGALIVPDWELLAERLGWDNATPDPKAPDAQRLVRETIQHALSDLSAWEQIRRFQLLAAPLTQEAGELTPTLKVKRKVVAQQYAEELAALFDEARAEEVGGSQAGPAG